jgi:hypothetical protein
MAASTSPVEGREVDVVGGVVLLAIAILLGPGPLAAVLAILVVIAGRVFASGV